MLAAVVAAGPATLVRQTLPGEEIDLEAVVGEGLTTRDWLVAGATLAAFLVAARILRTVAERLVRRTDAEESITRFVGRLIQNLVAVIGLFYALTALDVQVGPLLGALGVTAIAIAFAMTAILENVFASVILKTRRPIRLGDQITSNDHSGTVVEISYRTVVLDSYDGERVVLPSSMVNSDVIVNHTANEIRRTVLSVGVAYGTDLPVAQQVILDAVADVEDVHAVPAPQAWVTAFGDSSIDFDVRYWHAPDILTTFRVRSGVAMAIKAAFDDAGIEIPFPQRVVTMAPEDEPVHER